MITNKLDNITYSMNFWLVILLFSHFEPVNFRTVKISFINRQIWALNCYKFHIGAPI